MSIAITGDTTSAAATTGASHTFENSQLESGDFLKLMLEELMNQDPLDPVKNKDLLQQVSSIQNMQTLSHLDKTMAGMTFQQKVATGGALIGKQVSGVSNAGTNVTGVVIKVLAGSKTGVVLVTTAGDQINVDKVTSIEEVSQNG